MSNHNGLHNAIIISTHYWLPALLSFTHLLRKNRLLWKASVLISKTNTITKNVGSMLNFPIIMKLINYSIPAVGVAEEFFMEARSKFGLIIVNTIKRGFEYSGANDRLGMVKLDVLRCYKQVCVKFAAFCSYINSYCFLQPIS